MPFFTSENNPSPKEETLDFLRTFASLYNFTLWNIPNDSSSERFFSTINHRQMLKQPVYLL